MRPHRSAAPSIAFRALLLVPLASCGESFESEAEEPGTLSVSSPLVKSMGGALADWDFCNDGTCVTGEGDCDNDNHCQGALICGVDNGARFGMPTTTDVCWASTCQNGVRDNGETAIDRGGPCEACFASAPGSYGHCSAGCRCTDGLGDCDSNAECAAGLKCGLNNGAPFGYVSSVDVCVPGTRSLVVNEVDYNQPGTDTLEFVEIRNAGEVAEDLSNKSIQILRTSGAVNVTIALPQIELAPGGVFVLANALVVPSIPAGVSSSVFANGLLGNTAGVGVRLVELVNAQTLVLDTVTWEAVTPATEGPSAAPLDNPATARRGISRCPNSSDTQVNGVDFLYRLTTPGANNSCPP